MAAITLSRSEYLVILDILHANRIFGLEKQSLFPLEREEHLQLIYQGIQQLEARGLVKIEDGRHIIERQLLEVVAVVVRPDLVITTICDQAGVGGQLYLHYQSHGLVVEQVLPDNNHYILGQLPGIASAMDRILHVLYLPTGPCDFFEAVPIPREYFYQIYGQIESGDRSAAFTSLLSFGWPVPFARRYLATQADQQLTAQVSLMSPDGGAPVEYHNLTLIHDNEAAWLVTSWPEDNNQLSVRQINAASFRRILEETYNTIHRVNQV